MGWVPFSTVVLPPVRAMGHITHDNTIDPIFTLVVAGREWSAGRDLNPRLYGFAGRSLGPLGHRRMNNVMSLLFTLLLRKENNTFLPILSG